MAIVEPQLREQFASMEYLACGWGFGFDAVFRSLFVEVRPQSNLWLVGEKVHVN